MTDLLPDALRSALPPLYSQEHTPDPLVPAKFFTPDSRWTWYAVEFDGQDVFFGLVVGHAVELGYFRLAELRAVRGPLGRPVERARHWTPRPLSEFATLCVAGVETADGRAATGGAVQITRRATGGRFAVE